LEFDPAAFEDLAWWVQHDRSQALRIIKLIREIQRDPFTGVGKAEPLKEKGDIPG
jgi:toxin YoeB